MPENKPYGDTPHGVTIDVDWKILPADHEIGNDGYRFDEWRQTTTLGPQPNVPADPPPETDGRIESGSEGHVEVTPGNE